MSPNKEEEIMQTVPYSATTVCSSNHTSDPILLSPLLSSISLIEHDTETDTEHQNQMNSANNSNRQFLPETTPHCQQQQQPAKKPKWWRKIAGRRATKIQRDAISRMNERGYVIPKCNYGEVFTQKELLSFLPNDEEICLEIGFGNGENLLANARQSPNRVWIGAELFQPGVGNVLKKMEEEQQQQQQEDCISNDNTTTTTGKNLYSNIRIYPGDGTKLLRSLPSSSLNIISLPFPDPFPGNGQEKWRLLQIGILREMKRVLKQNIGIFVLATDCVKFDCWARSLFREEEVDWEEVVNCCSPSREDWLPLVSRYEEKGLREGRITLIQCWRVR